MKHKLSKSIFIFLILALLITTMAIPAFATSTSGDVSGAIQSTWNSAKGQIQSVVNNVVFPVIDTILVILFFVKLGTAYFDCAPVPAL